MAAVQTAAIIAGSEKSDEQASRHKPTLHCLVSQYVEKCFSARKHLVKGRLEAWNLTTKLDLLKASHDVYTAYIYIYIYLI